MALPHRCVQAELSICAVCREYRSIGGGRMSSAGDGSDVRGPGDPLGYVSAGVSCAGDGGDILCVYSVWGVDSGA